MTSPTAYIRATAATLGLLALGACEAKVENEQLSDAELAERADALSHRADELAEQRLQEVAGSVSGIPLPTPIVVGGEPE